MIPVRTALVLATALGLPPLAVRAGDGESTVMETITHWLSPELRRIDEELAEVRSEEQTLPAPVFLSPGERLGFHTRPFSREDDPDSIVIDLGRVYPIDLVTLVPAIIDAPHYQDTAYGFPRRFLIEASEDSDFRQATVIADQRNADFPNPGRFPVCFEADGAPARYLRFTSTRHFAHLDRFIWALGEFMVISGNRDVAAGARVATDSAAFYPPLWARKNLTNSQSIVGMPVLLEPSPTNGWQAERGSKVKVEKWVSVNLGELVSLEEIRLVPAHPTDIADASAFGFPRHYRIETRETESGPWEVLFEQSDWETSPGDNTVVIAADGRRASEIRMVAIRLRSRDNWADFALAEFQVYSGGSNIALGKPVSTSDSSRSPDSSSRWDPRFLVDGFSSQYRLVEWPEFLRALDRRRILSFRRETLGREREALISPLMSRVTVIGGSLLFVVLAGSIGAALRTRAVRQCETRQLREQIARDLHDDIGSNLGGISLLSESGLDRNDVPEDVREDLDEIRRIADASNDAMRDIIWLIDSGKTPVSDLVTRLREIGRRILSDLEPTFRLLPDRMPDLNVSLASRRHALLAFKETLYNISKHAAAAKVEIEFAVCPDQQNFQFSVHDDGVGFDPALPRDRGHGLKNLHARAERSQGHFEIDSSPNDGTTVRFSVPLK